MVPVTQLPSHLPDLCLENVFKRVPLRDLLRSIRVVCTNWRRVAPTELRRRRELVLVRDYNEDVKIREDENLFESELIEHVRRDDGSPWVRLRPLDRICFNALLVPGGLLTEGFTCALMDTLPNITHLTVVQFYISENSIISVMIQLVRLLNHYRDRLVSFKLNSKYCSNRSVTEVIHAEFVTNCTALFNSINQLQFLRHLTLNVQFPRVNFTVLPRLSILSRLDTFVSNCDERTWLVDSICQHATGHVRIDLRKYLSVEELLRLGPQLATKFTSVEVDNELTVTHYDNLRQFSACFLSISHLTVYIRTMPMTMLARCLSTLTKLIHLEIIYHHYIPEDEQPEPDYVQLPSIRLLSLLFNTRSHLDTSRLHLSQIFANLQVLSLDQTIISCDACEYEIDVWDEDEDPEVIRARVEHCIRLSRQPFRLCAHLHTIKHYGRAYPWQDLLPRDLITRDQF